MTSTPQQTTFVIERRPGQPWSEYGPCAYLAQWLALKRVPLIGGHKKPVLRQANQWIIDQSLHEGKLAYELVNVESGEVIAMLDLAWLEGLQTNYSSPVAMQINEDKSTLNPGSSQRRRLWLLYRYR